MGVASSIIEKPRLACHKEDNSSGNSQNDDDEANITAAIARLSGLRRYMGKFRMRLQAY
jgi:hypothetical protein